MLAQYRSPELHCFFGSMAHVQQSQIEKIRHPEQRCFRDALGRVHMNSAASQHAGAQRLHGFVAIDDEPVFRSRWKGNRRLLGHRTPPSLLEAAFRKAGLPLRSGDRHQKDLNLDFCLFRKGRGLVAPKANARACLLQAATRTAVFCKVELATSKFWTSGVPSTTFASAFSTSG